MSQYITALLKYLKTTDPDDWHKIALGWNWDNGHEPLKWIIENSRCDKATALLIYWHGGAGWYVQYKNRSDVPEWEISAYDLIKDIEQRYTSGFYSRQEIAYNPHDDSGNNWPTTYTDITVEQPIPAAFLKPLSGKAITTVYEDEGFPQAVVDEVENDGDEG